MHFTENHCNIFLNDIVQIEVIIIPKILVTEDQWIDKGMEQFGLNGVEGLVIEKMAAEFGCSKSSFYWYFKNRQEYIARIVERWSEISTEQVIRSSSMSGEAEDQLSHVLREMFCVTQKGDFLFYLRKLARDHSAFHAILEQIENTRMMYVQDLLTKLGMEPEVAEQKSRLLYHYYLGWYERQKHEQIGEEELLQHMGILRVHLLGI